MVIVTKKQMKTHTININKKYSTPLIKQLLHNKSPFFCFSLYFWKPAYISHKLHWKTKPHENLKATTKARYYHNFIQCQLARRNSEWLSSDLYSYRTFYKGTATRQAAILFLNYLVQHEQVFVIYNCNNRHRERKWEGSVQKQKKKIVKAAAN